MLSVDEVRGEHPKYFDGRDSSLNDPALSAIWSAAALLPLFPPTRHPSRTGGAKRVQARGQTKKRQNPRQKARSSVVFVLGNAAYLPAKPATKLAFCFLGTRYLFPRRAKPFPALLGSPNVLTHKKTSQTVFPAQVPLALLWKPPGHALLASFEYVHCHPIRQRR
jgi:hypothetical protein